MSLQNVQQALAAKHFQIVNLERPSAQQVRIVGRVVQDNDNWMLVVDRFNFWPQAAWTSDISMWFLPRHADRKTVFFWRLLFQCTDDISTYFPEIVRVITSAPRSSKIELTKFPLPGANANRYAGRHGARVGPAGKILTGPDLLRRRS
jgi:hypothetical protein